MKSLFLSFFLSLSQAPARVSDLRENMAASQKRKEAKLVISNLDVGVVDSDIKVTTQSIVKKNTVISTCKTPAFRPHVVDGNLLQVFDHFTQLNESIFQRLISPSGIVRRVRRAQPRQRQLRSQRRLLGNGRSHLQSHDRSQESFQAVQRSPTRWKTHGHQICS